MVLLLVQKNAGSWLFTLELSQVLFKNYVPLAMFYLPDFSFLPSYFLLIFLFRFSYFIS